MKIDNLVEKVYRRNDDHSGKKNLHLKIYMVATEKEKKMFDICFIYPHYHISGGPVFIDNFLSLAAF